MKRVINGIMEEVPELTEEEGLYVVIKQYTHEYSTPHYYIEQGTFRLRRDAVACAQRRGVNPSDGHNGCRVYRLPIPKGKW